MPGNFKCYGLITLVVIVFFMKANLCNHFINMVSMKLESACSTSPNKGHHVSIIVYFINIKKCTIFQFLQQRYDKI